MVSKERREEFVELLSEGWRGYRMRYIEVL
jgi:hypothetical protein